MDEPKEPVRPEAATTPAPEHMATANGEQPMPTGAVGPGAPADGTKPPRLTEPVMVPATSAVLAPPVACIDAASVLPLPTAAPPMRGRSGPRAWRWFVQHANEVAAIAGVIVALAGVWALFVVIGSERRAVQEASERRTANTQALQLGSKTLGAVERSALAATAADSARRAEAERRRAEQQASANVAEAHERQRVKEVAALDAEAAIRVGLLLGSLDSVGMGPTPNPREGGDYVRMTRALERFVVPRDGRSMDARGLTTYHLFEYIAQRDNDPEVRVAMLYLAGITSRGTYNSLSSGAWYSRATAPSAPVVSFREPNTNESKEVPLADVVGHFRLRRWMR